MRWEDERYVRLYTRDTTDWVALPWQSRVVFYELIRKVDRAGIFDLGKSGLGGVANILRMPVEVVEVGIAGLIADESVRQVDGSLVIVNFIEAQETRQSDAARKREQRMRDAARAKKPQKEEGEPCAKSPDVTSGHAETPPVTLILAVPSQDKTNHSLAGVSDARPPAPAPARVTSAPAMSPEPPPASEPKPPVTPPDEIGLSDNEAAVLSALRRWPALAGLATPKVAREVYGGGRPVPVILRGIAEYGEHIGIERASGSLEVADGKGLARYMATAAKSIAVESYRAERQSAKPTTALQRDNPNQPNWRQAPDYFKDQENEAMPWD